MSISLGAEGGASVRLILGGLTKDHTALLHTGNAVAVALFPAASQHSATINDNMGGYPFVNLHAAGVYRRGPHPIVTIDTHQALTVLAGMGYRNVDIDIDARVVPATATLRNLPASSYGNSWSWLNVTAGSPAPAAAIQLNPQPWRGFLTIGLEIVTLAGCLLATLGMRRRNRWVSGTSALFAAAAFMTGIVSAGAVQPDNLGVAGLVSALQLNIIKWTLLPCLAAAVAAVCLFIVTVERTKPPVPVPQFNAPPGWPAPPAGWLPMPGWQPDPTWPPAPPGWSFNVNPYEPPAPRGKRWRRR